VAFGKTAGAAVTYIVLASLQRGVSLLILPFVTHAMSPEEYGAASMLSAASLLLTALIATPLIQLIIRAAARGEENGPALLRAAGIYCYLIVPALAALVAAIFALFVPEILGVAGGIWAIELLAIGFQPAASVFALWVAQAREDLPRFAWLSLTSVLAAAASKIVLVVVMQLGVLGWVISDLISAIVSAGVAIMLVRLPQVRVGSQDIRYALTFTLPLVPHAVSFWALAFVSRPTLAAVSSLTQVGLLSFGLNLAQLAGLILAESNRAALPRYSREVFRAPTHETHSPVRWQLIAALIVPAVVGCGIALTGQWLFAEVYWPAFFIAGLALTGQAALGLYLIPMNYLTQTAGLTKFGGLASSTGAALTVILILVWGRSHGAVGAAYATAAGYIAMAALAWALTKLLKLDIAWRSWVANWPELLLALAALTSSIWALASPVGSARSHAFCGASLFLTAISIALTYRRQQ
jgi:O-antigen/teichoic acid export membrane protein